VLVDGFFNADPHPGNLLLIRHSDGSPQLGLIDYGQVKTLTKEQRHLFARLVLALNDNDKDKIVELMKEAGYRSERMDPDTMYVYAKGTSTIYRRGCVA
jgi:aarF domain-containing kinase